MGIEALTHDLAGNRVVPETDAEWDEWVSASRTRNHVLDQPLLDWLDRYGEEHGFERDPEHEPTDFLHFLFGQGNAFEAAVVEHLRGLVEVRTIVPEDAGRELRQDLAVTEETFAAMAEGVPIVFQGTLRDAETRTYGGPDLLVRSDVLAELFPNSFPVADATVAAPDLGIGDRHYRVVDIKYSTLHLAAKGELGNGGSAPAYKAQVYLYNQALGRLQGYLAPEAFVLGRGWEQTRRGETTRVGNCMDRIAPVANDYASYGRGRLSDQVEGALEWLRRVRREGGDWQVLPEPSVEELRPNAKGDAGEWSSAVKEIVEQSADLTQLWWVGVAKRREANHQGLTRWTDTRVTPKAVGVEGRTTQPRLQALLDVNREAGPDVRPARVEAARGEWIEEAPVEFYVDFETVGDLDDDFSGIPERGGQPLIFMIGCGHMEEGEWRFECFITDRLDERSEAEIIDDWFEHMTACAGRRPQGHPLGAPRDDHPRDSLRCCREAPQGHRLAAHAQRTTVAAPELVRLPEPGGEGGAGRGAGVACVRAEGGHECDARPRARRNEVGRRTRRRARGDGGGVVVRPAGGRGGREHAQPRPDGQHRAVQRGRLQGDDGARPLPAPEPLSG